VQHALGRSMAHIRNRYIEIYKSNAGERTRAWERSLPWSNAGRSTTHNGALSLKSFVASVKGMPYQTGEAELRDFFNGIPLLGNYSHMTYITRMVMMITKAVVLIEYLTSSRPR
jgi:hypothetical protein